MFEFLLYTMYSPKLFRYIHLFKAHNNSETGTIIASPFTCEEIEVQRFLLICPESQEISSRVLV